MCLTTVSGWHRQWQALIFYEKEVEQMSKPVIAVVGRPNVGKSTLFNKLVGQRLSIVEDTPGVTRDRIYAEVTTAGHPALLHFYPL